MNIEIPKLIITPHISIENFVEAISYLTDQIDVKLFCVYEETERLNKCCSYSDKREIVEALMGSYMWEVLLIFEKNKFPEKYTLPYIEEMASKKSNRKFCNITEMNIKDLS